jgi:hypothetical protein
MDHCAKCSCNLNRPGKSICAIDGLYFCEKCSNISEEELKLLWLKIKEIIEKKLEESIPPESHL